MDTSVLPGETLTDVLARLRRAEGQIRGVIRALEEGTDCVQVVRQISAAKSAVERAGVKLISAGLVECLKGDDEEATPEQFEKMFLELS